MVSGTESKALFNNRFRILGVGVGGWNCPCCGPAPRHRKQHVRRIKRGAFKRYVSHLIAESVQN